MKWPLKIAGFSFPYFSLAIFSLSSHFSSPLPPLFSLPPFPFFLVPLFPHFFRFPCFFRLDDPKPRPNKPTESDSPLRYHFWSTKKERKKCFRLLSLPHTPRVLKEEREWRASKRRSERGAPKQYFLYFMYVLLFFVFFTACFSCRPHHNLQLNVQVWNKTRVLRWKYESKLSIDIRHVSLPGCPSYENRLTSLINMQGNSKIKINRPNSVRMASRSATSSGFTRTKQHMHEQGAQWWVKGEKF